jgi:acylphosphatase
VNSRPGNEAARRILVRGRVQGVYFRASTAERAIALSLRGTAENLADGSVRVLAAGRIDALGQLIEWLKTGPPMARVDAIEVEEIDAATVQWPAGFRAK